MCTRLCAAGTFSIDHSPIIHLFSAADTFQLIRAQDATVGQSGHSDWAQMGRRRAVHGAMQDGFINHDACRTHRRHPAACVELRTGHRAAANLGEQEGNRDGISTTRSDAGSGFAIDRGRLAGCLCGAATHSLPFRSPLPPRRACRQAGDREEGIPHASYTGSRLTM